MILSVVVLPHPLGPMMLVSSPLGTSKRHAAQCADAAGELLGEVDDRGPAVSDHDGRVARHAGLISGRKRRCSMCWSSDTLTLATRMIDRIDANIAG